MSYLYHTFLYEPLLNALIFLYNTIAFGDLGVAIILLTIAIRLILYPLFQKSVRYQALMQRIQPEIKKIQDRHPKNREQQAQEMLALYRTHKINPFSGIFLLFIQLPVLIALYQVFIGAANVQSFAQGLYPFVHAPDVLNATLLGLINLHEKSIVMVGLAAGAQYLQGYLTLPKRRAGEEISSAERMSKNMVFFAPFLTLFIFWSFPAAVSLYWAVTSLFSVAQQLLLNRELSSHQHDGTSNIHPTAA